MLFALNNKSLFESKKIQGQVNSKGLISGNEKVADLVNKDTDGDGIPDWEEGLWGTDPTKKETTPGISDSVVIAKLKEQQQANGQNSGTSSDANLTQTDKFSREFLATVTTLNQNGVMDQATIDKLGNTLAENIKNSAPRKVYTLTDIKVTKNETATSIKKYNEILNNIYAKNPAKYTVLDVLQKFSANPENVDTNVLSELDPIITEISGIINGMLKMDTPPSLASLHLNVINGFERILENINDIKLYNTDVIISLSGITKYTENATALATDADKLSTTIYQKLKN